MGETPYKILRATIEHLPQLKVLWVANEFPAWDLEKKLTEFLVVESPEGLVQGAIGLEIFNNHARIHSEAFFDQTLAEEIRPILWERILTFARASGVTQLWTQEQSPFWEKVGMRRVSPKELQALPSRWRCTYPRWLHYKIVPEALLPEELEKQITTLIERERSQLQKAVKLANIAKTITLILVTIFFAACLLLLLRFMVNSVSSR